MKNEMEKLLELEQDPHFIYDLCSYLSLTNTMHQPFEYVKCLIKEKRITTKK